MFSKAKIFSFILLQEIIFFIHLIKRKNCLFPYNKKEYFHFIGKNKFKTSFYNEDNILSYVLTRKYIFSLSQERVFSFHFIDKK